MLYAAVHMCRKAKNFWHNFLVQQLSVDLFDNIIDQFIEEEVIEVDQYEETNDGGYRGGPAQRNK